MPTLTPDEQTLLLLPQPLKCDVCGKLLERGYCRSCDEFYFTCGCNKPTGHEGHRTY